MSFLDNLLNRNPTADWQGQRGLQLVLDMDSETFCGVGIDDPVSRLEKFGPAEDAKAARYGAYEYPSRAFHIATEEGRVVEFTIHFYDHERYTGRVRLRGQDLPPGGAVKADDIIMLLGPPQQRNAEEEDDESLVQLIYPRPKSNWHFEFDGAGVLESIWVGKND